MEIFLQPSDDEDAEDIERNKDAAAAVSHSPAESLSMWSLDSTRISFRAQMPP